jgi:hypothetical protein
MNMVMNINSNTVYLSMSPDSSYDDLNYSDETTVSQNESTVCQSFNLTSYGGTYV